MLDENNGFKVRSQMEIPRPDPLFNVIKGMEKLPELLDMASEQKEAEPQQGVSKGTWLPEEDKILMAYVEQYGPKNWNSLQSKGLLKRNGKSCRLRWVNQLKPGLQRNMHGKGCKRFSESEEKLVIELQKSLGNRWAQISKHLPGRTDNDVKNFWNLYVKRQERARRQRLGMIPLKQTIEIRNSPASSASNMESNFEKPHSPSVSEEIAKVKGDGNELKRDKTGNNENAGPLIKQSNGQSYHNNSQNNMTNNQKSSPNLSSLQQRRNRGGNGLNLGLTAAVTNLTINCPKLTKEEEEKIAQCNVLDWLKTPTTPSSNYFPWLSHPSPSMRRASPRCNPQKGFPMPHKVHSPFGGYLNPRLLSPGAFFLSPKASPRIPRHLNRTAASALQGDHSKNNKDKPHISSGGNNNNNPNGCVDETAQGNMLNAAGDKGILNLRDASLREPENSLNESSLFKEDDLKDRGSPINPSGLSTSMNDLAIAEKFGEFDRFVDETNTATSKLADISPSDFNSSEWFASSDANALFGNSGSVGKEGIVDLEQLINHDDSMDKDLIELISSNFSSKSNSMHKSATGGMQLPLDLSGEMMNQSLISPNTPYLPFLSNALAPLPEDSILFGGSSDHITSNSIQQLTGNESTSDKLSSSIPTLQTHLNGSSSSLNSVLNPSSVNSAGSPSESTTTVSLSSGSSGKASLLAPLPGKSTSFLSKGNSLFQGASNGLNFPPSIPSIQSQLPKSTGNLVNKESVLSAFPTTSKASNALSAVSQSSGWNSLNDSPFDSNNLNRTRNENGRSNREKIDVPNISTVHAEASTLPRSNSQSSKAEVVDENSLSAKDLALKKSLARESLLLLYKGGLISNQSLISTFQKILQSDDSNYVIPNGTTSASTSANTTNASSVSSNMIPSMNVNGTSPLIPNTDPSYPINSRSNPSLNSHLNSNPLSRVTTVSNPSTNPSNDINLLTENILKANPSWSIDDLLNMVIGDSGNKAPPSNNASLSQNQRFTSSSLNAMSLEQQQQQQKLQLQNRHKLLQQQQNQPNQNVFLNPQPNDARFSLLESASRLPNGSHSVHNGAHSSLNATQMAIQKLLSLHQLQTRLGDNRQSIGNSESLFGP